MKIQIMSDLHLELGGFQLPKIDRDLLILAGDVHVGRQSIIFLKEQLQISPVVYILGNHEFYGNDINQIVSFYQQLNLPGLYFLHNSIYKTNNVRFLGCPLWTDVNHRNKIDIQNVGAGLSDFREIQNGFRPFTVQDSINRHVKSVIWLRNEMSKPFQGKTIVITHHLPSLKSIHAKFRNSHYNPGFASDLDNLILEIQPDLWIHGHTHDSMNYILGNTHMMCNPRGYKGEENTQFDPRLILDL